jgi:type 1 glutamine amidotransferase
MTTDTRRALVVRGGWDGHHPLTISDGFVPFLQGNALAVTSIREHLDEHLDPVAATGP